MALRPIIRGRSRGEDGYALLVIMVALSVFVITLAQALPRWATQIRREREARSIDYGREYRGAIKRYFHKNGRYPASIEVLMQRDGNGLRYLRQAWQDPLASKGAAEASGTTSNGQQDVGGWQVIHFGQAVAAEIVDQPPASMASSTGGIAGPNLTGAPGPGVSGVSPTTGASAMPGTMPGTTPSAPGAPGMPAGAPATGVGTTGTPAGTSPGALPGSTAPSGGGGGAVIGVAPLSKKPAIHAFNGFDIPNDWQFVYNYAQDRSLRGAAIAATNGLPGATSHGPANGAGASPSPPPSPAPNSPPSR